MSFTKSDVANKIKEATGCYIFDGDHSVDPDNRDYDVSYEKALNKGFNPTASLDTILSKVIKYYEVN